MRVGQPQRRSEDSLRIKYPGPTNDLTVLDANGEPIGGVIVFLDDGYLALLEVYSYDRPISPFPEVDRLVS